MTRDELQIGSAIRFQDGETKKEYTGIVIDLGLEHPLVLIHWDDGASDSWVPPSELEVIP